MFVSESYGINKNGNLTVGNIDTVDLVKEYGTPLYVMDDDLIRKNCRLYVESIKKACGDNGLALFASKAFSCIHMCKLANEEKMGLDVVSGGEIYTALKAGFPASKIYFHGNNKTYDELELAISNDIGRIVVDNIYEIDNIEKISERAHKNVHILIRVKPGIEAHTHEFIMTGQIDSKFGFALETGEAFNAIKYASKKKNIIFEGLHCHIGSQIFEINPFVETAKVMVDFIDKIFNELKITVSELNLGGGYGIQYLSSDNPVGYSEYIGEIAETVRNKCSQKKLKMPKLIMEPGRSIVGNAGTTLYTVGAVKDIPGVRKYVSVDGGMGDNPRYIMYGAEYTAVVANKADKKSVQTVTIAGKCCESGDILIENIIMPEINVGDVIAVLCTGAYNYSMSSNYNRIPKPGVVAISNQRTKVIVKKETYDDIIRNDVI